MTATNSVILLTQAPTNGVVSLKHNKQLKMKLSRALPAFLLLLSGSLEETNAFNVPSFSTVVTDATTNKKPSTKEEISKLLNDADTRLRKNHDNEAWNALFVSCPERPHPVPIVETEGSIPNDFPAGSLLRLGPNGAEASEGFFDGDGMIQCITFPPPTDSDDDEGYQSTISATYIDTRGRQLEKASGNAKKFKGTLGGVPRGYPMIQNIFENALQFQTLQAQKDTCNTALAEHGGRILALMEQCPPTEIEITRDGQVKTIEACASLDGAIDRSAPISGGALSAHGRTCPWTGDRIHVSYRSDAKPFLRVDTFASGWSLKESKGIDIPAPIFLHDSVITKNYVVIMDLPLTLRVSRIVRDRFPVEYEPDHPARIGLVPRAGGDTRWFDCEPGVVLHAVNAWETPDGNQVILQGFRGEPEPNECYLSKSSFSFYHEYSIDMETGVVTEQTLNTQECVEFPAINDNFIGQECSSTYAITVKSVGGPLEIYAKPSEGLTFNTVVKMAAIDNEEYNKGDVIGRFQLPERWFAVSEPTVVAKKGKDDGEYVLLIATHVPEGVNWKDVAKDFDKSSMTSKVFIVDGENMNAGPVYSATLPFHVPYGLHSEFIDWEQMK